jgi:hypothetical protein
MARTITVSISVKDEESDVTGRAVGRIIRHQIDPKAWLDVTDTVQAMSEDLVLQAQQRYHRKWHLLDKLHEACSKGPKS